MLALRRVLPRAVRLAQSSSRAAATRTDAPPQFDPIVAEKGFKPLHSHAFGFKLERYFVMGMIPLFPTAYFIHGPVMDTLLTFAITLHAHWGIYGIVGDYGRPFVLGDTLAKAARVGVYVLTICLLAGLLHFNQNDVGLTRAFEMVWSL